MTKHFQTDDTAARLDTKAALRRLGVSPAYPGAPFSKRPEGRARRIERAQVRAAKSSWLNS